LSEKRKLKATSVSIFASLRARMRVDKRVESFRQFRRSVRATPRLTQSHTPKPRAQLRVASFLAGPEHDGHVPEKSSSEMISAWFFIGADMFDCLKCQLLIDTANRIGSQHGGRYFDPHTR